MITELDCFVCAEFAEHKDLVQCMSWKLDGSLLVTSSKDKKLRVIDPRANEVAQVSMSLL